MRPYVQHMIVYNLRPHCALMQFDSTVVVTWYAPNAARSEVTGERRDISIGSGDVSGSFCFHFRLSDSMYHILSPTESCSIVARLNETLSLLCVHPPPSSPLSASRGHVTSAEATSTSDDDDDDDDGHRRNVECHFRSFVWRRIRSNGETTTITDSRRFNVRRGGDQVEKGSGKKISILKIGSLQTEDVSRSPLNWFKSFNNCVIPIHQSFQNIRRISYSLIDSLAKVIDFFL